MQLESIKRLRSMDDISSRSKNGKQQTNDSVEKDIKPVERAEDESKYPPLKTVILSLLSIYMAFFLTALVNLPVYLELTSTNIKTGPHHHWRCYPRYIKRVQELRRHILVRSGISIYVLHSSISCWQNICMYYTSCIPNTV
jgi:hypothetical protein